VFVTCIAFVAGLPSTVTPVELAEFEPVPMDMTRMLLNPVPTEMVELTDEALAIVAVEVASKVTVAVVLIAIVTARLWGEFDAPGSEMVIVALYTPLLIPIGLADKEIDVLSFDSSEPDVLESVSHG
jgi:hypothetical protein